MANTDAKIAEAKTIILGITAIVGGGGGGNPVSGEPRKKKTIKKI